MKKTMYKIIPITAIFNERLCYELFEEGKICEHYKPGSYGYTPATCAAFDDVNIASGRCDECIKLFGLNESVNYEKLRDEEQREMRKMLDEKAVKCPTCGMLADKYGVDITAVIEGKRHIVSIHKCRNKNCNNRYGYLAESAKQNRR